ncbi:hypothetical protein F511_34438 [Dorcoceras hygrometricum]|uniref:Uncharacterized protein n=1 Tax=Dorcoceras hygrometricum TaxID=472368 RepID=A0A2Z7B4R1_9LAMI|nr:hypothetical protein F511_34438 [Dorcoceras hygrometricum]
MQNSINQCYEMHEATKESVIKTSVSTGKSSQVEPLHRHSVSTGEIIGTTHLSASHNVALNRDINQSIWLKIHQFNTEFIIRNIAMSTLKAVRAAQIVPHSFNLPQQISQRHGKTQPAPTCPSLVTPAQHSRHFLEAEIQKLKRAEEALGFTWRRNSNNTATSRSSPRSNYILKWVAIERATQGESSATNLVQNNGWNRQKSGEEMFG